MRVRFKNYYHRKNFAEYISPKNSDYYSNRSEFIAAVFLCPRINSCGSAQKARLQGTP